MWYVWPWDLNPAQASQSVLLSLNPCYITRPKFQNLSSPVRKGFFTLWVHQLTDARLSTLETALFRPRGHENRSVSWRHSACLCFVWADVVCTVGLVSAIGLGIHLVLMKSIDPFRIFFKVFWTILFIQHQSDSLFKNVLTHIPKNKNNNKTNNRYLHIAYNYTIRGIFP